jgi:bromodomain-containing factor 1
VLNSHSSDYVALKIPAYPKIVKKPMDMSLMRRKLENGEYANAAQFRDDFDLMIRNCLAFNPVGNPVHNCGLELKKLFDEKWAGLPPLRQESEDEYDEDDEDEEEETRLRTFLRLIFLYDLKTNTRIQVELRH